MIFSLIVTVIIDELNYTENCRYALLAVCNLLKN